MRVTQAQWDKYTKLMSALKGTARKKMDAYISQHGIEDMNALIDYAYGLSTKYGEGAAAVAAEMYDDLAKAQGAKVPEAELAATASYTDTAKAVTYARGVNQDMISGAVETLVKQAGEDTTIKNAVRDGAEFAWVPHGDSCPMCLAIASNGWRYASKKTIKGDHADHIHSNCDCSFAIRFDGKSTVEGYDPDKLRAQYNAAEGRTWKDKVNFMRREQYKANGDKIRAQKRENYRKNHEKSLNKRLQFKYNNDVSFIPLHTIIKSYRTIAGQGSSVELHDAPRLAEVYHGEPAEWSKLVGKVESEKYVFDIHWYEDSIGVMYEPKIKFMKRRKK